MKQKNLIVVHLESLSNQIFYQEIHNMPFLSEMMHKSMNFSNFTTTATSSMMAFTDFCYGNDYELDLSPNLDQELKIDYLEENIFNILKDNNYAVKGIAFPKTWRDDLNNCKIWDLKDPYDYSSETSEEFYSNIENFIVSKKNINIPVAMHIWDIRSHIFYMDNDKQSLTNFLERRSYGYNAIDNTFKFVYELLQKENMLEDTLIVAYGDHGDELWSHNLNAGFCHSIEPYSSIVHTPCLLIDSELQSGLISTPVSLIDLKWIILDLLKVDYKKSFDKNGWNALKNPRNYCFSKNLLANQTAKVNGVLRKAYSVTNENYHLIVSAFGLEFYMHKIDPSNTFNILNLFTLNEHGELIDFDHRGAWHSHFKKIMFDGQLEHIKNNFSKMYKELYNFVDEKNKYVSEHGGINTFKLFNFKRVKQQGSYQWNS